MRQHNVISVSMSIGLYAAPNKRGSFSPKKKGGGGGGGGFYYQLIGCGLHIYYINCNSKGGFGKPPAYASVHPSHFFGGVSDSSQDCPH